MNRALQILKVSFLFIRIPHSKLLMVYHLPSSQQDEFEMNMRLLGAPTLKDVVPSMVDASNVHTHIVAVPGDNLYNSNCKYFSVVGSPCGHAMLMPTRR